MNQHKTKQVTHGSRRYRSRFEIALVASAMLISIPNCGRRSEPPPPDSLDSAATNPAPDVAVPDVAVPDVAVPDVVASESTASDSAGPESAVTAAAEPAGTDDGRESPSPAATNITAEPASVEGSNSTASEPEMTLADASGKSLTSGDPAAELEKQLASFQIPPAWIDAIEPKWDTAKPWSEARQEIRRLLGAGDDSSRREGVKLTWEYLQKKDIGNGHEYGMYMFLGGEPLWAVIVYREWVARTDHEYPPYFGIVALSSLYSDYGLYEAAVPVLEQGLNTPPPDPKWTEMRQAEMHDALGDLYVAWGKIDQAKTHYSEAVRLYPQGKPPYGQHLLPRRAKKVQSKLDLLSIRSLAEARLTDGHYKETSLGYSGDIHLNIEVKAGRIANIDVKDEEKIDQNACSIIPRRIIEKQSLQVDGVSGATVTKDAIIGGTLRALKKAGLK